MLSEVTVSWPEIHVTEVAEIADVTTQKLIVRVGSVFSVDREDSTGIWVNYCDGDELYGPVLIDYASWKKLNKHVRKRWRDRSWSVYVWLDRVAAWMSKKDIRLL